MCGSDSFGGSTKTFSIYSDGIHKKEVPIIDYKFNENALLKELQKYIDSTYGEHYAKSKIQSTEVIIDQGHGVGFCAGNVLKYIQRYGKKDGLNRKDLLKVLHYAIILLYVHDRDAASKPHGTISGGVFKNSTVVHIDDMGCVQIDDMNTKSTRGL